MIADFYKKQYPMMWPFEGKNFGKKGAPRLLLIGESHYLPEGAKQHLTPQSWYGGTSIGLGDFDPEKASTEREWISTSLILERACKARFAEKPRSIWRNAFKEINAHGPRYVDYVQVADDIAFYNFFLRPARQGQSLEVKPDDVSFANRAFRIHLERIQPSAVVFLSRLAHRSLENPASCAVPMISTPHPGCRWWNRPSSAYGGKRGREVLADFVRSLHWPLVGADDGGAEAS